MSETNSIPLFWARKKITENPFAAFPFLLSPHLLPSFVKENLVSSHIKMMNSLLFIFIYPVSTCFSEEHNKKEPMVLHRRLEERESGVGVSDSSGFLPKTPHLIFQFFFKIFSSFNIIIYVFFYFKISVFKPHTPKRPELRDRSCKDKIFCTMG